MRTGFSHLSVSKSDVEFYLRDDISLDWRPPPKMAKKKPKPKAQMTMRAFLACEAISLDPSTKKNSLYGLFDLINADSMPGVFKPFNLYVQIANITAGRHTFMLSGTAPGGAKVGELTDQIEFVANPKGDTVIAVGVSPIPILREGDVRFTAHVDGKEFGWQCIIHIQKTAGKAQ